MAKSLRHPSVLFVCGGTQAYERGVLESVASYAMQHGGWDIVWLSWEHVIRSMLTKWTPDGIITRGMEIPWLARVARRREIPLISFGLPSVEDAAPLPAHCVVPDNQLAGQRAAEHLMERGLRHLAFFGRNEVMSNTRARGVEQAVAERGLSFTSFNPTSALKIGQKGYIRQISHWLKKLPRRVGIVTASDQLAVLLNYSCQSLGLNVPGDVAIIGIGNDDIVCRMTWPLLSSVQLDSMAIGTEAARRLDLLMSGQLLPATGAMFPPLQVVARQSTDMVAVEDEVVRTAMQLLRDSPNLDITIDQVARAVSLSRRWLQKRFRDSLGRTPMDELLRLRIQRAEQLLGQTDMKISLIAHRCGLSKRASLNVMLKKARGLTPGQLRARLRQR